MTSPSAAFASAEPLPGWPGPGGALGFLGRFTEPRKGFPLLCEAFCRLAAERPGLRLLVAGPGDPDEAMRQVPAGARERIAALCDDEAAGFLELGLWVAHGHYEEHGGAPAAMGPSWMSQSPLGSFPSGGSMVTPEPPLMRYRLID